MRRIWRTSNTGTSRMLRIRSPSLKTWWWKILRTYWMWVRMTADHRDQVKKWSKPKVRSSRTQYYVLGEWSLQEKRQKKMDHPSEQFNMYSVAHEFYGFDGEAIEFEWEISQNNVINLISTMSERWIRTILWRIIFMSYVQFNEQRSCSWSTILDIYSESDKRFRQRIQRKFEKYSLLCPAQSNLQALWFDIVEKKRSSSCITSSENQVCKMDMKTFDSQCGEYWIHRRIPGDRKIGSVIEMKVVRIMRDHG